MTHSPMVLSQPDPPADLSPSNHLEMRLQDVSVNVGLQRFHRDLLCYSSRLDEMR